MTLVELMISTGLAGLLATVAMMLMYYAAHNFAAMANYVDLDRRSRNVLDQMTGEIRQADKLNTYATNQLVFQYGYNRRVIGRKPLGGRDPLRDIVDGLEHTIAHFGFIRAHG